MNYWLMKSEPTVFSIDDLQAKQRAPWDGVRNYQARNMMRDDMHIGDTVFFYHSNCTPPGIVGVAHVCSSAYIDDTAFDPNSHYFDPKSHPDKPRWMMVDVQFVRKFSTMLSLAALKAHPGLSTLRLVQPGNRLSIMPVTDDQAALIFAMEKNK